MIDDEFLKYITLDELKEIRDKWYEIADALEKDSKYAENFDIANHYDCYIDREYYNGIFALTITTDEETDETFVLSYVTVYYGEDGCCEVNIVDIERLIKEMDG